MKNLILRFIFPIIILVCVGLFFVLIYNTQHVNTIMGAILGGLSYVLLLFTAKKTIKKL